MTTVDIPDKVLSKLPKTTPPWAVGVVSIIISVAASLSGVYFIAHTEIKDYIRSEIVIDETKIDIQRATVSSILELVQSNSKQITELSSSLSKAQDQNFRLSERVSNIEKELSLTQTSLEDCKEALKNCKR